MSNDRRQHRRTATLGWLTAALLLAVGCNDGGESVAPSTSTATESADVSVESTVDAAEEVAEELTEPYGIPRLVTETMPAAGVGWTAVRAGAGGLFAVRPVADGFEMVRLDVATGAPVATAHLLDDSWTVSDHGPVVIDRPARTVTVLDPQTLAVRHVIALPPDFRAAYQADTPRPDPFWISAHRFDADSVQGVLTQMASARLDLATGQIAETREMPPCGATSTVEQPEGTLVAAINCSYQIVTLDPQTNETTVIESFPSAAQLLEFDGEVWIRWKPFGYLGRLDRDDGEIETLDLNVDGPTVVDLNGLIGGADNLWVLTVTADPRIGSVLNKIDTSTFEVEARVATGLENVAFVGDDAFGVIAGQVVRFDPSVVDSGTPDSTERPSVGKPRPAVPGNDDERAAMDAFAKVFDPSVPNDVAAPYLAGDPTNLAIRTQLTDLVAQLYPGVELVVSAVAVDGDSASIAYSYLKDDKVAFVPLFGSMTRVAGVWVVDRAAVCQLASQAGVPGC